MRKKRCPPTGAPDWMVSYGDMMSLLLTFFIMLFAISSLNAKKFDAVAAAMADTFGTQRRDPHAFPGIHSQTLQSGAQDKNRSMTVSTLAQNPAQRAIQIRQPLQKVTTGIITFAEDSDKLTQESQQVLAEVYNRVKGSPLMIELRGHTSLGEQGPNRDSMDLAYARAYSVREYLIQKGIDPSRIFISSMGAIKTTGSVSPKLAGYSNAYVEVFLIHETPISPSRE